MEQNTNLWNRASKEGFLLALICVICETLAMLANQPFLNSLLWIVRTVGSIWLLRFFMSAYGAEFKGQSTKKFGYMICLCSSTVCAVWAFVMYGYLFPSAVTELFDQVYSTIATIPDFPQESKGTLLKMEDNYVRYATVITFIWDVLLGLIISSILARSTSRTDIFETTDNEQQ